MQNRTQEKQWRENAKHAWEIAPILAVFLPYWLNNSQALVAEVGGSKCTSRGRG